MGQAGGAAAHGEFIRLDRAESMRLLASAPVGRLIFTVNALPAVRLMNFALVDGLIVLRTAADTTAARKADDAIVAFEVDDLDAATSSGWSVVVTGRAMRVTDPELIARYQAVPLTPWAPGERDQFVAITTEMVEGRRVSRAAGSADSGRGPGALPAICGGPEHNCPGVVDDAAGLVGRGGNPATSGRACDDASWRFPCLPPTVP
ncbi:MAG TPA: pyridoxamine 5'-phosphate oxidase family protein [Streptosporangiaceae bacterium]|nr:pyridoxamine 5'-phosphate oxidase family protein [Streptosporangiaceae bacterium]